jgi:hypothetical protein
MMNRLVGIACEGVGRIPLVKLLPKLKCDQVRPLVSDLEKVDATAVPWREVLQTENRFVRAQLGNFPNPIKLVTALWQAREMRKASAERHDLAAAHLRLLTVELALRAYRCDGSALQLRYSFIGSDMLNLFEAVRTNPSYNKLEIGDFLFVEYTCGVTEEKLALWTDTDHLMHVVSGAKTWHTMDGVCQAHPGETLFVKKGATIVEQHWEADVCLYTFFIPDTLVRSTVREMPEEPGVNAVGLEPIKSASRVENDIGLTAFFQSMRTYFSGKEKPSEPLVRLKLKELIISVLTSRKKPSKQNRRRRGNPATSGRLPIASKMPPKNSWRGNRFLAGLACWTWPAAREISRLLPRGRGAWSPALTSPAAHALAS